MKLVTAPSVGYVLCYHNGWSIDINLPDIHNLQNVNQRKYCHDWVLSNIKEYMTMGGLLTPICIKTNIKTNPANYPTLCLLGMPPCRSFISETIQYPKQCTPTPCPHKVNIQQCLQGQQELQNNSKMLLCLVLLCLFYLLFKESCLTLFVL